MNALVMGNLNVYKAGKIFEDVSTILDDAYHSPTEATSRLRVSNIIGYSFVRRSFP